MTELGNLCARKGGTGSSIAAHSVLNVGNTRIRRDLRVKGRLFDVSEDGEKILVATAAESSNELVVVVDWLAEVERTKIGRTQPPKGNVGFLKLVVLCDCNNLAISDPKPTFPLASLQMNYG